MTDKADEPRVSRHLSRVGKRTVGGHFEPEVALALKALAVAQDTTVQVLLARAINDLLERHGGGRPASEEPLPRGGAAQLARAKAERDKAKKIRSERPSPRHRRNPQ